MDSNKVGRKLKNSREKIIFSTKKVGRKMEITTLLEYSDRSQLRAWLQENHSREKECWVVMSRSKTPPPGILPYIEVVEEAGRRAFEKIALQGLEWEKH